jgi:hypothetical protein
MEGGEKEPVDVAVDRGANSQGEIIRRFGRIGRYEVDWVERWEKSHPKVFEQTRTRNMRNLIGTVKYGDKTFRIKGIYAPVIPAAGQPAILKIGGKDSSGFLRARLLLPDEDPEILEINLHMDNPEPRDRFNDFYGKYGKYENIWMRRTFDTRPVSLFGTTVAGNSAAPAISGVIHEERGKGFVREITMGDYKIKTLESYDTPMQQHEKLPNYPLVTMKRDVTGTVVESSGKQYRVEATYGLSYEQHHPGFLKGKLIANSGDYDDELIFEKVVKKGRPKIRFHHRKVVHTGEGEREFLVEFDEETKQPTRGKYFYTNEPTLYEIAPGQTHYKDGEPIAHILDDSESTPD